MTELLGGLLAAAGGALLGLCYYAGLWFTLWRLPGQAHPALWVFGSFTLRLAASLAGFSVTLILRKIRGVANGPQLPGQVRQV